MKKWLLGFVVSLCMLLQSTVLLAAAISPVGRWQTIDDVTGKPKAVVQIGETANHRLYGHIISFNPSPGQNEHELCTACEGSKHNRPILGLVILENLQQRSDNPNEWGDGEILDPKNGKTYRVTLQLIDKGQQLHVRGYIGMPLFGRSQTWIRLR